MKPKRQNDGTVYFPMWSYFCRKCGEEIPTYCKYCPDCGVKVDWGGENE